MYINDLIKSSMSGGYLKVVLCAGGMHKTFTVHRLVATVFIPNPNNLKVVNHIDSNKTNNNIDNLEWCTQLKNRLHSIAHKSSTKGKKVYQFSKDGTLIATYSSIREASQETGIKISSISGALNRRIMYGGGFCWSKDGEFHQPIHKQCKPVQQICALTGNILAIFTGATDANKITGISCSQICHACKDSGKTAGGYKWRYGGKMEDEQIRKRRQIEEECAGWARLDEFPRYKISKDGRIYSEKVRNIIELKSAHTYFRLPLKTKGGETKNMAIHRLVALAYIPNPNNLPVVNHIDGNKFNNSAENLEWTSYQNNAKHAARIGLTRTGGKSGTRYITNSPFAIKVGKYTLEDKLICIYDSISRAAKDNDTEGTYIMRVCQGKQKTLRGYKWKYLGKPNKHRIQKTFPKARKVGKYSLDGEFMKSYATLTNASVEMGCSKSSIMKVCQGKQKTTAGYIWKYMEIGD